jgi:hypothetical protein
MIMREFYFKSCRVFSVQEKSDPTRTGGECDAATLTDENTGDNRYDRSSRIALIL